MQHLQLSYHQGIQRSLRVITYIKKVTMSLSSFVCLCVRSFVRSFGRSFIRLVITGWEREYMSIKIISFDPNIFFDPKNFFDLKNFFDQKIPMMLKIYLRKFPMMVMTYLKKFPMMLKAYLRKFLMVMKTYLKSLRCHQRQTWGHFWWRYRHD